MTAQTGYSHFDNAERNKKVLLNIIREKGPLSRREISNLSGLSITTTKRLIEDLFKERILVEGAGQANTAGRGRRAQSLRLNGEYGYAVGLNIEPSFMEMSVLSFSGRVLAEQAIDLLDQDREAIIREIVRLASSGLERPGGKLLGVGVGIAGLVDAKEGIVHYCPSLPGWENIPLAARLAQALHTDVLIDDTSRCLALTQKRYGPAGDMRNFLYIYIGRGVGAGIVLDNRIYRGQNGISGEFGHITIKENGPLCNCGNRGCLEALVSEDAILTSVRRSIQENVYSSLKAAADSGNDLNLETIAAAARTGDKLANMVIHDTAENIGIGVADLTNIFDPGVVILGGEVIEVFGDLLEGITRTVRLRALNAITRRTQILTTTDITNAGSRGAATLIIERFCENDILNLPPAAGL